MLTDKIMGFELTIDGRRVPQALVPTPVLGASPIEQTESKAFTVRLGGIDPTKTHQLEITAVNRYGVVSKPSILRFKPSKRVFDNWETITSIDGESKTNNLTIARRNSQPY